MNSLKIEKTVQDEPPVLPHRVLLCVPAAMDAAVIEEILTAVGARGLACRDPEEIAKKAGENADAILISEEILDQAGLERIIAVLHGQPEWSDIPVLLVSEGGVDSSIARRAMQALSNILVLDRPVRLATMTSVLRQALRARGRQYRLRDLLEELRRSEAHFREAFEYAPVGMVLTTLDGRLIHANDAYCRMVGYSCEELLGGAFDYKRLTHPEDLDQNLEVIQRLLAGKIPAFFIEKRYIHRDGSIIWVRVSATLRKDAADNPVQIIGLIEDITLRKEAEEQMRQTHKMEAIGRLAGGMAHEFNNLLNIIHGYTELIGFRLGKASPLQAYIREITGAAQRAAQLSDRLLAYSRNQVRSPESVDLNLEIKARLRLFESPAGKRIAFRFHPADPLWPVRIDPNQLEAILVNLADNAVDAISGTGTVTIATQNIRFDRVADALELPPGDYVRLSFSDDGAGMSRETRERVFDPFFTTKDVGRGTGLGLSTILGIVKQNNGGITVESEPGKGSTFHIFFPRGTTEAPG